MSDAGDAFPMDALLREREWVRALARSLVRTEADADDLEQEAWVEALRRPPRDARSPRGWLATVMHRLAARRRRTSFRVRRRETSAARPEALPAAADLVAVAEQHRRLVGLVLELEEPLRGALLARYVEGLPPREIARRTGEPVKTVASRLARGLDRLRERLDAESDGVRERWLAALASVADLDGGGGAGGPAAVAGASPAATGAAIGGGLLMATKAKTAAAVAAVLLAGGAVWLAARPTAGDAAPTAAGDGARGSERASLAAAPRPAAAGMAPGASPAVPESTGDAVAAAVLVRVVEAGEARRPIAGATVLVRPWSGPEARATTGPAGEPARIAIAPTAGAALWAWAEGHGIAGVCRPGGLGESVEVVLETGKPVAVSFVSATDPGHALTAEEVRARTGGAASATATLVPAESAGMTIPDMLRRRLDDPSTWTASGEVALGADARLFASLPGAAGLVLVERPGDEPYFAWVEPGEGGALRVRVPLREQPTRLHVRVVEAESGAPVPRAVLTPWAEAGDDALFVPGAAITADARGEADLPVEGPHAPSTRAPTWWVTAPGRAASIEPSEARGKGDAGLTVALPRTAAVHGRAWTGAGAPAVGAVVLSGWKGRFVNAVVGADGTYAMEGVAVKPATGGGGGSVSLILVHEATGAHVRQKTPAKPGETLEVDFGRPASGDAAAVRGRVTAAGRPLASVHVGLMPGGSDRDAKMGLTDADGRFRWDGVPAGSYALMVMLGDPGLVDDFKIQGTKPIALAAGDDRALDFDLPGGTLRVRVVDDRTGAPVPGAVALATPRDGAERDRFPGFEFRAGWSAAADAQGVARLVGLPVGVPHRVEGGTMDRRLKGFVAEALPTADPAGVEVELRVK